MMVRLRNGTGGSAESPVDKAQGAGDALTLEQRIAVTVEAARHCQHELGRLEEELLHLRNELFRLLETYGRDWHDEQGFARIEHTLAQATYDSAALDELIVTDPLRYGWLKEYRRPGYAKPTVEIE